MQQTDDEAVLQLSDAVASESVTQDMLNTHISKLSEKFGIPVECHLISYAKSKDEQADILTTLGNLISEEEHITLDVTHGFRHLPMLALVAARYLSHVRNAHIENVYYGALEMSSDKEGGEITPVLELNGMLEMLDWVEALAIYKSSGNYRVFADLYQKDGMPEDRAKMLSQAAFYERSSNPIQARQNLTGAFKYIDNHSGPLGKIFSPSLAKDINWFRNGDRADWELALADRYIQRQDYLRAAIYMLEGVVSDAVRKSNPPRKMDRYEDRDSSRREFLAINPEAKMLDRTRNALVHGVRPFDDATRRLLQREDLLQQAMHAWRKTFFN